MKKKSIIISIIVLCVITIAGGVGCYYYKVHSHKTHTVKGLKYILVKSTDGLTYKSDFNDRNDKHLSAAMKLGLSSPLKNRAAVENVTKQLVRIKDNDYIKVDKLTHSVPYLTKGASSVLDSIGKHFQDVLVARGYCKRRLLITSLLRTNDDVKRLQPHNPNAVNNSAHLYATTFDITYVRYCYNPITDLFYGKEPADSVMLSTLCEVLRDMKRKKQCYIKYEQKQQCFHRTSRI